MQPYDPSSIIRDVISDSGPIRKSHDCPECGTPDSVFKVTGHEVMVDDKNFMTVEAMICRECDFEALTSASAIAVMKRKSSNPHLYVHIDENGVESTTLQ